MDIKGIKRKYKQNKKRLKQNYLNEIKIYNSQFLDNKKEQSRQIPKRSVLEEVGNAVTHGVGSIFSILALFPMLFFSERPIEIVSAILYFAGLFILFTMSTLYHSFRHGSTVKKIFRIFDYTSIYLLIGSTFIPILLCYIGGSFGLLFFIIQWIIIILGITLTAVFGPHKLKALHMVFYLVLGWSGLMLIPSMINRDFMFFIYILLGGVIYSLGIIPFTLKKKASHFIWHFFVLFGAIIQWVGIFIYIYL